MKENFFKKLLLVMLVVTWSYIIPQPFALAQAPFPIRPVYFWVMWPAGGIADTSARAIAERAEQSLGQKIVVITKPGAGGTLGTSLLAKEKPDGYTVGISSDTAITKAPHMMDLGYDPFRDLSPIVRVAISKACFAVRTDSPFKKWEDVVDWAKKNPGKLVYGHIGKGTSQHLGMIKAAKKEGFSYKDVPFAGDAPTVNALLGGHVMVAGGSSVAWRSHVDAKTVRVLITVEKEGVDFAPEGTTFEKMDYEFPTSFFVIYGPKGIADPVRIILEKAFIEGIQGDKFKAVAKTYDLVLVEPLIGNALHDYLKKTYLSYEELIKEAGIYKIERK